jgi:hypothetical protein
MGKLKKRAKINLKYTAVIRGIALGTPEGENRRRG